MNKQKLQNLHDDVVRRWVFGADEALRLIDILMDLDAPEASSEPPVTASDDSGVQTQK